MRDLAPIAQEVFAPSAQLTPIVFRLVFLVPAAELGCKSWLPQSYGHELLLSTHPASESKSAEAINRLTLIEQLWLTFQCRWAPVLLSCTQVWTLCCCCCCCCKHGTTAANCMLAYSTKQKLPPCLPRVYSWQRCLVCFWDNRGDRYRCLGWQLVALAAGFQPPFWYSV